MPKSLIVDWEKNSILLVSGHFQASQPKVEALAFEPIGITESGQSSLKDALLRATASLQAKGEITVLVARELVELRTLQIPKMDPHDVPDVIRFQAQRQFTNMSDAWIVDYVLLPLASGQEMQTALVAALSPTQIGELDAACAAAGLHAGRVLLRPLEIARMATQSGHVSRDGTALVVCLNQSLADLLVLRNGQVVQVRSMRLPTEADMVAGALVNEVKRSLVAASEELAGRPIDSMLLVASDAAGDSISQSLSEALKIPVVRFSPEQLLPQEHQARAETEATRLAAVAGALAPQGDDQLSIDFKSPKRRPPPKKNTRTWILAAAAGVVLLLAGVAWYTSRIRQLNAELAIYSAELQAKEDVGKSAEAKIIEMKAIEEFMVGSPNWLDELAYIAQRMPPADQIKLESPSFSLSREGEGVITVTVKADDAASIAEFEDSLRSENHAVIGTGASQLSAAEGNYRWSGLSTIRVAGRGWQLPARASAEPNPTDDVAEISGGEVNDSDSDSEGTEG
jgi:Tfp pilus assembly PilM family ATPase/uncharacterized small protein (DUF1192 family)